MRKISPSWQQPYGILHELYMMEEERYLRTVANYLQLAGVTTVQVDSHASLGNSEWYLTVVKGREIPGSGDVVTYDFYVSSGGAESGYKFQIVGDLDGNCETFIDVPFERPVTAALIILNYMRETYGWKEPVA